jgi:hypothetical protein
MPGKNIYRVGWCSGNAARMYYKVVASNLGWGKCLSTLNISSDFLTLCLDWFLPIPFQFHFSAVIIPFTAQKSETLTTPQVAYEVL